MGSAVAYFTYGTVHGITGSTVTSAGAAAGASSIAVQFGTTGSIVWSDVLKTSIVAAATAGIVNAKVFDGQSLNQMAGLETAGSGSALTALGSVSCPTVVGCLVMGGGIVLAGVGADQMTAGVTTVISGAQQSTVGGALLQQIGMSPQAAELWYGTVGGLGALSAEAALVRWNMNAVVQNGGKNTNHSSDSIIFNPNIENHISKFDGLSQKSGVSGTHNSEIFLQAVSDNGLNIIQRSPGSAEGIEQIKYLIPSYDRAGNIIGYKSQEFVKTVYDPSIFSDQKIMDLGREAAKINYNTAISQGWTQYDSTAGGITFRVYLDKVTGAITNFHPK